MAEKTKLRTCGFTFHREPLGLDRTVSYHWTTYQHDSKKNTVLTIVLKRYARVVECTLRVGAVRDNARVQGFNLKVRGPTYRSALLVALDVGKYPLRLLGFSEGGKS